MKPFIKIRKCNEKMMTLHQPNRPHYTGHFVYKPWFWIGPYCVLKFLKFEPGSIK